MTGEIRTTSSTGGEKGVKPQQHSLIPSDALDVVAELYGFGVKKYSAHNWRKGYEWSKSIDALLRHAHRFNAGEDIDEETGLPHLAGVVFHALTLITFMKEHPEFDDRYKPEIRSSLEAAAGALGRMDTSMLTTAMHTPIMGSDGRDHIA